MSAFGPAELARLAALRDRYRRGDFRERADADARLRFARWLVAQGRVNEAVDRRDGYAALLRLLAQPSPRRKVGARALVCRLARRPR
jgi:hypothetical protein